MIRPPPCPHSCDNCHSHVAMCLSNMRYSGSTSWNMVKLAAWVFVAGKHVTFGRALATWLPFLLLLALIFGLAYGT
jgi:hypothetical protein